MPCNDKATLAPPASVKRQRPAWYAYARRACLLAILAAVAGLSAGDYVPGPLEIAAGSHRLDVLSWELQYLPGKWRHLAANPPAWFAGAAAGDALADVDEFFARHARLRTVDRRLAHLSAETRPVADSQTEAASLLAERTALLHRISRLRPSVEQTLESAVARTLRAQGFGSGAGIFPPVDTALVSSPAVLVTSPRARIARGAELLLHPGVSAAERAAIESRLESQTGLSALVVDTGGIAFYPSIAVPHAGLDYALEIIAHEWVHQWLVFRPLGRRYFQGGDLLALNETVASIAGRELGTLAKRNLGTIPSSGAPASVATTPPVTATAAFDFQSEMRQTRVRVDALLADGKVAAAEDYMEERRQVFVQHGYPIRRLNQAYFAFHGSYANTGAAGVNVIGQQVAELRRRSPSLAHFLRTAAQFTGPQDLSDYLER